MLVSSFVIRPGLPRNGSAIDSGAPDVDERRRVHRVCRGWISTLCTRVISPKRFVTNSLTPEKARHAKSFSGRCCLSPIDDIAFQHRRPTYDHRVKAQVIAADNPDLFPELKVARSTGTSWIRRGTCGIVSFGDIGLDELHFGDGLPGPEDRVRMLVAVLGVVESAYAYPPYFGPRAQRKPLSQSRVPGLSPSRTAERMLRAMLRNEPPRRTRLDPRGQS